MSKDLKEGVDYVINEDGKKVHPETGKVLRGFALHKDKINKGGRPLGARNKSSLMKAQFKLDEGAEVAVEVLMALMTNDKDYLGKSENVSDTIRMNAAKEMLAKAIANEKDKIDEDKKNTSKEGEKEEDEDDTPIVSLVPIKTG